MNKRTPVSVYRLFSSLSNKPILFDSFQRTHCISVTMSNRVSPGEDECIHLLCGDDEAPHTQDKRAENTTPTPSISEAGSYDVEKGNRHGGSVCVSVPSIERQECEKVDGRCVNSCNTKTISYTAKKRVINKKTLLWYDRSVRITKPFCVKARIDV